MVVDLDVFTDDGRGFAGVPAGFVDGEVLGLGTTDFEDGSDFCGAEDVAGSEAVGFFDAPEPATARLPPVEVSLNPRGLEAVPTRGVEAFVQSLTPLP